jgi:hypothetical protein
MKIITIYSEQELEIRLKLYIAYNPFCPRNSVLSLRKVYEMRVLHPSVCPYVSSLKIFDGILMNLSRGLLGCDAV